MEKLDKVELVREKTGATYQIAKDALEACDYDVLDAIIWLEDNGKTEVRSTTVITENVEEVASEECETIEEEVIPKELETVEETEKIEEPKIMTIENPEQTYETPSEEAPKDHKARKAWASFKQQVRKVLRAGMDTDFIAERDGKCVAALPLLLVIIGILAWGASIWLLIIGLFFGFKYRIEDTSKLAADVNDVMDKVANAAEGIKDSLA